MVHTTGIAPDFESKLSRFLGGNRAYASIQQAIARREPFQVNAALPAGSPMVGGDKQQDMTFRMDATGHVLVTATTDQAGGVNQAVTELFTESTVLLAAVTKALGQKSKTLYDYDSVRQVLMGCGDFVSLGISDKKFHSKEQSVTLDMAVIGEVMGCFVGIESLASLPVIVNIAKNVVGNVGAKLTASSSSQESSKKIGHLMFICQDLMGAPLVSLSYFYSSYSESVLKIKTPCAETDSAAVDFSYHQEDYMFVSPESIKKYAPALQADDKAYQALVDKLAGYIK